MEKSGRRVQRDARKRTKGQMRSSCLRSDCQSSRDSRWKSVLDRSAHFTGNQYQSFQPDGSGGSRRTVRANEPIVLGVVLHFVAMCQSHLILFFSRVVFDPTSRSCACHDCHHHYSLNTNKNHLSRLLSSFVTVRFCNAGNGPCTSL